MKEQTPAKTRAQKKQTPALLTKHSPTKSSCSTPKPKKLSRADEQILAEAAHIYHRYQQEYRLKMAAAKKSGAEIKDSNDILTMQVDAAGIINTEQQRILSQAVHIGDPKAKELLVMTNQRAMKRIARHYQGQGVGREDLAQDATVGLLRGLEKYDPDNAASFLTYASWWARQNVSRSVQKHGSIIKLPAYLYQTKGKVESAIRELAKQRIEDPDISEICAKIEELTGKDIQEEHVLTVLQYMSQGVHSLDLRLGEDEDGMTVGDRVHNLDNHGRGDMEAALHAQVREQIGKQIREAIEETIEDEFHRILLYRRFGFEGYKETTPTRLSQELGETANKINKILERSLDKLAPALAERGITGLNDILDD